MLYMFLLIRYILQCINVFEDICSKMLIYISSLLTFASTWVHSWFLVRSVLLIFLVFLVVFLFFSFFFARCFVCPMLSVSLYCPLLIAPAIFSNVFKLWRKRGGPTDGVELDLIYLSRCYFGIGRVSKIDLINRQNLYGVFIIQSE